MAYEYFDFPYHTFEDVYPTGKTMQFGRGWEFAPEPRGPDQLIFRLSFTAMKWFVLFDGSVDSVTQPKLNARVLTDFYETHRTWKRFQYPHPTRGIQLCRFKAPLAIKQKPLGLGSTEPFMIELIQQP